jgi:hypothetical protein
MIGTEMRRDCPWEASGSSRGVHLSAAYPPAVVYKSALHLSILKSTSQEHPHIILLTCVISPTPRPKNKKIMKAAAVLPILAASLASAKPLEERQSCPKVHVFGARETTAPAGYGTSQGLVNMVVQAYSGTTSEAISYPACGGQSSCGGASYDSSASQGTTAVVNAVTSFNKKCPDTAIVLIGYSQVRTPSPAGRHYPGGSTSGERRER